jgi:hypothetical protein
MQRYVLFAGDRYYPAGGWHDYKGRFDSQRSALKAADAGLKTGDHRGWEWYQVVDLENGGVIEGVSEVRGRSPDQEDIG